MNLVYSVEKERKKDILVLNCVSVCTLCVHRTAHSCCRVHQSAAVFIGWWPRNANSCITEGQRHKVRQGGHRTPDVFTDFSSVLPAFWYPFNANCLSAQDLLQHPVGTSKPVKAGRHVGHVHLSTKEDTVCLTNKTVFKMTFLEVSSCRGHWNWKGLLLWNWFLYRACFLPRGSSHGKW